MRASADDSRFSVPDWLSAARGHGLLARLPEAVVGEFVAGAHRVEYPKGGSRLQWDERPMTAIVLQGTLRSFLAYPDGSQITERFLRPGDMVGVFVTRQPRIARGVQALESSELLMAEIPKVRELAGAHPEFAWALIEELTDILKMTYRALYLRAFASVRQRVAVAIMDRARLAGDVVRGSSVTGTQAELATAAGTVREVVATALQAFRREGLVEVRRGGVVILDPPGLAREAETGFEAPPPELAQTTD